MTWANFKVMVSEKVRFDGESVIDPTVLTFNGSFDVRTQFYFGNYCEETHLIYEDRAPITLTASARKLSLLDPAVCAKLIFEPRSVWINGVLVAKRSLRYVTSQDERAVVSTGVPNYWSPFKRGEVWFDAALGSTYSDSYVSGFAQHPAIANDNTVIQVPNNEIEVCALFCASGFALPVVNTESGIARLTQYNASAGAEALRLRGERLQMFLGNSLEDFD